MQGFPTSGLPQPGAHLADWSWAATSPSLGRPPTPGPGTYAAAGGPFPAPGAPGQLLPGAGLPPIAPMPGPSALGPGSLQGSVGTGGVAGVGINPVSTVAPPAATGGPHPLPALPACPLPQGFPNPFEMQQLKGDGADGGVQTPLAPGTTTVAGPRGYLPGLGYFGSPGRPGTPGPLAAPPVTARARPLAQPQAAPAQAPARPAQQQAGQPPSPFWIALAWGLLNTPAAKAALGDRLTGLMAGADRMRTIQAATALLLSPPMQNAFRALAGGSLQQLPFSTLFADLLRGTLDAAGLGVAS